MNDDDKLFERMKDLLADHEEPYVLGSWERFEKHKGRTLKKQKQKFFIRAAAILLLGLASAYLWISLSSSAPVEQFSVEQPQFNDEQPITPTEPVPPSDQMPKAVTSPLDIESSVADHGSDEGSSLDEENIAMTEGSAAADSDPSLVIEDPEPVLMTDSEPALSENADLTQTTDTEPARDTADAHEDIFYFETNNVLAHKPLSPALFTDPSPNVLEERMALTRYDMQEMVTDEKTPVSEATRSGSTIVTREALELADRQTSSSPLSLSVAYASMMNVHDSKTDLGSGAGVYAGWNFAPKFTLSTGVAISQNNLSYSDQQDNFMAETQYQEMAVSGIEPTTMSEDNLSSVEVNFLNLEIPLDLRYHISDRFSISAGVSSVTFLREEYDYNFEFTHRPQSFGDPQTGSLSPENVVTYRTTHTESEPALDEVNWGAFYTFSVGYQHEIFNRYTASFEPFVKLPAGQVTSRGVRYSTGGLQLRISF